MILVMACPVPTQPYLYMQSIPRGQLHSKLPAFGWHAFTHGLTPVVLSVSLR
jgi:hypothetical protein